VTRAIGADSSETGRPVAGTFPGLWAIAVVSSTAQGATYGNTKRDHDQQDRPDARPWLYGIATNLIGRHRRTEIRQYRAYARTGIDPVTEPFTERVEARVSASGESMRLAAAVAKLPAAYRDALLLVAWGNLTYEQAALALGVPIGTVRSRLSRARGRLRQALAGANSLTPNDSSCPPPVPRGDARASQPQDIRRGDER
jgi:RNA polymerase sigma factor (sigma-70 family)